MKGAAKQLSARPSLGLKALARGLLVVIPLGLSTSALAATTLTVVPQSPLRSLDPVITTAHIIRNYGYMVYDTLLSYDSKGKIQPQMLEKWEVSDDGKTYTFVLRDGLKWHDGTPVTSADCLASITRWASLDKAGQVMASLTTSMEAVDDKTFKMSFSMPTDLVLRGLAKKSTSPAFMMPERVAKTPGSKAITESIGSGPFKFVRDKYVPGVSAEFAKNEDYVPRKEPADGLAGGHVVKVDKVVWRSMPDSFTAINALKNGEVDYIERVDYDLLPLLEKDKNINVIPNELQGGQALMRMNHIQPPFNDKLTRQAALAAIGQAQIMKVDIGDKRYYRLCGAIFGCGEPLESSEGVDAVINADPEKAKQLLKESSYKGEKVVIMQPTDYPTGGGSYTPVIAQQLRDVGFNVELQAMDWQSELVRRTSRKPVEDGGWSILTTNAGMADLTTPLAHFAVATNGDKAWFGWPSNKEIEDLRYKFTTSGDFTEQKALAAQIQKLEIENVIFVPLGQWTNVGAAGNSVKGILKTPAAVYWNIEKVGG
ncbi:ABC transporter substrate-binding protein [Castellaniella sp. GW247-6E4]|uniref:ABC transporter substrate-binding protein n=1 Tax=Castellaniella sp. GW247-6E4 TaxID=3140380 RepID=UPI0033154CB4